MQMCGAVATVCMGSSDLSKVVMALNLLRRLLACCSRNPEAAAVLPDLMHGLLKRAAEPSAEVRISVLLYVLLPTTSALPI